MKFIKIQKPLKNFAETPQLNEVFKNIRKRLKKKETPQLN